MFRLLLLSMASLPICYVVMTKRYYDIDYVETESVRVFASRNAADRYCETLKQEHCNIKERLVPQAEGPGLAPKVLSTKRVTCAHKE